MQEARDGVAVLTEAAQKRRDTVDKPVQRSTFNSALSPRSTCVQHAPSV
jgi:hypothetical protein